MIDDRANLHERLSRQDKILGSIDTNLALLRKDIFGNGQPGRLTIIESKIDDLEAHKNRAIGWALGAGAVIGAALTLFEYFHHVKP